MKNGQLVIGIMASILYCMNLYADYTITIHNNNQHKIRQIIRYGDEEYISETLLPNSYAQTKKIQVNTQKAAMQVKSQEMNNQNIKPAASTDKPETSQIQMPKDAVNVTNNNNLAIMQQASQQHVIKQIYPVVASSEIMPENKVENSMPTQTQTGKPSTYFSSVWTKLARGKFIYQGLLIGYGAMLGKLFYDAYALSNKNAWGSWKEEIPLELLRKAEQKCAQELFNAIQATYAAKPTTAHFLSPLVYFITDIDREIDQHNSFINLHGWLKYLKCSFFFPKQENALRRSIQKIKRLEFLKHVIVMWVSEYKVEGPAAA
jgi:hypothetical protein